MTAYATEGVVATYYSDFLFGTPHRTVEPIVRAVLATKSRD